MLKSQSEIELSERLVPENFPLTQAKQQCYQIFKHRLQVPIAGIKFKEFRLSLQSVYAMKELIQFQFVSSFGARDSFRKK